MKISQDIYVLDCVKECNIYLIKRGKESILVDTGPPGYSDRIIIELRSMGVTPDCIKHILLTHHDVDHIGNARAIQYITGAKLWAAEEDIPYIKKEKRRHGLSIITDMMTKYDIPTDICAFTEGQKIGEVTAFKVPGHTPGSAVFLYQIYLFIGDMLYLVDGEKKLPKKKLNWNQDELMKSIKKMETLEYSIELPGHGGPMEKMLLDPYALGEEA